MKHLICSGCSFTRQYGRFNIDSNETSFVDDYIDMWRWPHWIQKLHNDKFIVYNIGSPTNDNSIIKKSVYYQVSKLIKNGIDPSDIVVMVQWSNYTRNSFYIDQELANLYNSRLPRNADEEVARAQKYNDNVNVYAHISDYIGEKLYNGQHGYYLLTGGYNHDHIQYEIKQLIQIYLRNFQNPEESMIRFFDNVIALQSFLDSMGIPHLSFNLQNNFVTRLERKYMFDNWPDSVYKEKWIPDTLKLEDSYENPYIQHLFELINLDDFWFFNSNETKRGGLTEWAIKTYDIDKHGFHLYMEHIGNPNVELGHVSQELNKLFVETEIKDFLLDV